MARALLCVHGMAMTRASAPDPVTLANLHAVLDGVVEIEALVAQLQLPGGTLSVRRHLQSLATEMRTLLVALLRPAPR